MGDGPTNEGNRCSACGAELAGGPGTPCPSCGRVDAPPGPSPDATGITFLHPSAPDPYAPPPDPYTPPPDPNPYAAPKAEIGRGGGFHIGSLMMLIAGFAVVLGLGLANLPLAVVVGLVAIPALVRTEVAVGRRETAPDPVERLFLFSRSFGVSALTFLAAGIAFTATCFPIGLIGFNLETGGSTNTPFFVGVVVGLLTAGFVVFLLARSIWPLRDRRR